ncbi:hypothetical protein KHA80_12280 [Anaerobacillus sp. HL2]|nr:hypothetical protein KHA80_12280 [Anaerobacillus sp. HL2]
MAVGISEAQKITGLMGEELEKATESVLLERKPLILICRIGKGSQCSYEKTSVSRQMRLTILLPLVPKTVPIKMATY